ncbi:uncharacterized protein [Nicotiana tomentosiformis]|uniref:uncharacterized protein n=1 Tax=Nicotiana tomentosiformis TaxID=4098 RepID=UPI00388CD729
MVDKGCLAYLAFVRDVSADTPTVESVPIVRDFLDVFPADLQGMPPDRDIDFGNDLIPGTQPIYVPPYRIAPAQLKELKEQLQELLDKDFIKPSVSPWGAPVIFVKKNDGTMWMRIDYSWEDHEHHMRVVLQTLREKRLYAKFSKLHGAVGGAKEVVIGDDGFMRLQGQIYVLNVDGLRDLMLEEVTARAIPLTQVKEHQKPGELIQKLEMPEWKWERITMDFVIGLPQTLEKYDNVWVIMDRLTKSTHFIPVVSFYYAEWLAHIYIREIICLHGVPISNISDQGTHFTL